MKCNIKGTLNYSPNRPKFRTYNLLYKESKLLQNLKNNLDLILKPADKGDKKLPFDPTLQIANDISIFIRFLYSKFFIS